MMSLILAALVAQAADVTLVQQGRLLDGTGAPITGSHTVGVTLTGPSGPVWSDSFPDTPISDGYYAVVLGSRTQLPSSLFATPSLTASVTVDTVSLGGPQPLHSVPYAAYAAEVGAAAAGNLLGNGGFDLWQPLDNPRDGASRPDLWYASGGATFFKQTAVPGRAALTSVSGGSGAFVYQTLEAPAEYAGLPLSLAIDAQVSGGSWALEIDDGLSNSQAILPDDGQYHRVVVNHTVASGATRLGVRVVSTGGSGQVQLDRARLVVGEASAIPWVPLPATEERARAERFYEYGRASLYSDDGMENEGDTWWWRFRTVKAASPSVGWAYYSVPGVESRYTSTGTVSIRTDGFGWDQENGDAEAGGAFYYKVILDYTAQVPSPW